jgi:DNA-binding response OmpR family regulator
MKILVIDSDLRFRRLVMAALEPFDAVVIQSTSLKEADIELQVSHPDFIVLDDAQPDGNGIEWLASKRALGIKTAALFFSSSCHSTEHFCTVMSDIHVRCLLHKPVTAASLSRVFEHHLSQKDEAQSTAAISSNDMSEIEKELKALSVEYIRELPERFQFLKRQVVDLKQGRGEPDTAKNEAHKIKGTAASYGVHDVGEQAVIIDDCLRAVCNQSASAEIWAKLEASLDQALKLSFDAVDKVDAQTAAPAVYDVNTAMRNIGLPGTRGQTIVIVDDDADFTKRVSLVLGYEDMLVYSFNDAKNIITVLEHLSPDLLVLDLNMPDMDGFEVCKRIRIDGRYAHLPIVFLTAQTGWETRVAAFDAGADDYIPKPVVNQELIARIRVRAEKSQLQKEVNNQSSVNKLLWQALLMVLVQQPTGNKT